VRVLMPDAARFLELNPTSVQLDEERVTFTSVQSTGGEGSNRWFDVELARADRRAAVRALFESHGYKVSRVIQTSFGPLTLPRDLPRGRHRELKSDEMGAVYELAGMQAPSPVHAPKQTPMRSSRPKPHRRTSRGRSDAGR
jgi:23S rRNA pseudouridine2605 synthase